MNNNDHERQTDKIKTRHGQVAGQLINPLKEESTMINFNTTPIFNQMNAEVPELPEEARLPDWLGQDACPWLDDYVAFSKKWSPESYHGYHEACGLFVLSTVAARRVVFNLGGVKATNLYILLVGRTSIHAKTTAARIGTGLLKEANLGWLLAPNEITPQKLIEIMSSKALPKNYNSLSAHAQKNALNRVRTAGQRGWFLDEFGGNIASMMQLSSVMFGIKNLIRILDSAPEDYEYSTIKRGQNLIFNPYLSILGNITIADLIPYAKKGNNLWGDGFLARFCMVVPPNDNLSFGRFPNEKRVFPESLTSPLKEWSDRLGFPEYQIIDSEGQKIVKCEQTIFSSLTISDETFDAYYEYRDALKMMMTNNPDHDLDGNYLRLAEKALRIAALFASLGGSECIELAHWAKAQEITEHWRVGLHELHRQVNDNNRDQPKAYIKDMSHEEQILRAVSKKGIVGMREIAQFTTLKTDVIKPIMAEFVQEGKLMAINDNGKECYKLPSSKLNTS